MTGGSEIARKPSEESLGMKHLRKRRKLWHHVVSSQVNHSAQVRLNSSTVLSLLLVLFGFPCSLIQGKFL